MTYVKFPNQAGQSFPVSPQYTKFPGSSVNAFAPPQYGTFPSDSAAPATPLTILGADVFQWVRADLGVTLNGATVSAWADQSGNARDWTQGAAASQPTFVASDARFSGKPSIEFDGTDDSFANALGAAAWKFMHDGTGCMVGAVFHCPATTGSRVLLDSCNVTAANVGFSLFFNNTTDTLNGIITSGGGVTPVSTGARACADAASHMALFSYGEGAAPTEWEERIDQAATASGNSTAAPSAANPIGALIFGRTVGGTLFLRAAVAELVIADARILTAKLQELEAYFAARYGL